MDADEQKMLNSSGRRGDNAESRKREARKSTTDASGYGTVKVEEDVRVVPPSDLLKNEVCCLSGGAFLRELNRFLNEYNEGKVVLGRLRRAPLIVWEDTDIDRSYYGFFMDYPPIVRFKPPKLFKETRVVKREE